MIHIVQGTDILYTIGDTFELEVVAENATAVRIQIVNQNGENVINKTIPLINDRVLITLELQEQAALSQGEYEYRLTTNDENDKIVTKKSGKLKVRWQA